MKGKEREPSLGYLEERASAFQQTIVYLKETYPVMAVMTYDHTQHQGANQVFLAKFIVGIEKDGQVTWLGYEACDEGGKSDNIPGGLKGVYTAGGHTITAEIYPQMVGRDTLGWEGGAIIRVACPTADKIWFKFGVSDMAFMHFSPNQLMTATKIDCENGKAELAGVEAILTHDDRPIVTVVRSDMDYSLEKLDGTDENHGTYVVAQSKTNQVCFGVGFSESKRWAEHLAAVDCALHVSKIEEYYKNELDNWYINTPDKDLNEAFGHARLNMEYAWLRPYGWIESFHHWPTMWHMEQTAQEEWTGNFDRVRETLRSQMQNLIGDGAIPDMCCTGKGRRDWGGNNQFFFREVDHYLRMTGDREFAAEVEPYMYKVLNQCFDEYDQGHGGVLCWHTQIGNQEDFECTPGPGAATGSTGVEMLTVMSNFMRFMGKDDEADKYGVYAAACREKLYEKLWQKDLGRFAWYEDLSGTKRLDTTYHGICYPIINNLIDPCDARTSLDHLKHRLSGPEGEIYQSNHFGDHAYDGVPTWGMQCGSDMQPFGTAAYAKAGMNNDAVKPLSFIARRVCGPYQRGSWPETANETRYAYFSPSAGVFSQGVIESIFGLTKDAYQNRMTISPCFPDDWDSAEMKVRGAHMTYQKDGQKHVFTLETDNDMEKVLRWKVAPCRAVSVTVNGKKASAAINPGCGWFEIVSSLSGEKTVTFTVEYTPIDLAVSFAPCVAEGQDFALTVKGAELCGVDDRCGVFSKVETAAAPFRPKFSGAFKRLPRLWRPGRDEFCTQKLYAAAFL